MAGPAIKLSVTGNGKETIDGLNRSLDALKKNLVGLKDIRPDLGSLDKLTDEMRKFRTQFSELAQGQATALAEMAEAVKGGFAKAVGSVRSGGKSVVEEIKSTEEQQARAFQTLARQMEKQAQDMSKASARVTGALVKQAGKGEAGTQTLLYGKGTGTQAELAEMAAYYRKIEDTQRAGVAKLEAEYAASVVKLEKSTASVIKAATQPAYAPAGAAWWDKVIADQEKATAKLQAEYDKSIVKLETAVDRTIKAVRQPGYQPAGAAWWDKVLKEEEEGLQKLQRLDAAYNARGARGQIAQQVQARSQLDQGLPQQKVVDQFGPLAVSAAQASTGLQTLKDRHASFVDDVARGTPKVVSLKGVLNDLHSAARGAASGFNAMFLTWGNLGPLLAGAALSNAFVQTVKMGSEVAHELSIIKILGEESATSVAGLQEQLLGLSRNGPFGPQKIAEAFKSLTLAGLSINQQRSAIGDVLNFAIAGTTSIEQAAESLVQMSTAFGYSANSFGRVGDVVSKAAAVSLSSVESLTRSMQSASEVHVLYGASLVDVATNLAILSQLGIRGTAAGTALKNMYAELSGSTSIVRKNMLAWKIDALDPQTGKIKELLPLLAELSSKYNKLNGPTQTRFIQDLSNTRGGKDLVAILSAYNTKAAEGGDGISQLEATRRKIDEAYGYQAVAAAQLSLTAKNQMASVASSLQSALVQSFQAIEPQLLTITTRLRALFSSGEFQNGVQNLALAVANLGTFLVEHLETVKNLAIAYLAWKTAMFTSTTITAALGVIGALTTAYKELRTAKVADTIATEANAAVQATAGVAAGGALRGIVRFIPYVGALLAAGIVAWDLYWASAAGKKGDGRKEAELANQQVLERLKEETKRAQLNLRALQGKTAEDEFNASQVAGQTALSSVDEQVEARQKDLEAAQTRLSQIEANIAKSRKDRGSTVETGAGSNARAAVGRAQADYDAAVKLRSDLTGQLSDLRKVNEEIAKEADAQAKLQANRSKGDRPTIPEGPGAELNSLRAQYSAREKTLKEQYANEQKLLDSANRFKLISETTYALQTEDLADRSYQAQLDLLTEFEKKAKAKAGELAGAGKATKSNTTLTELAEIHKRLDEEIAQRKAIADLREKGTQSERKRELDTELARLQAGVDLMEKQADIKAATDQLLPEEQAYAIARNAEAEKYNGILEKTQQLLRDAQRDADQAADGTPLAARLQARIEQLNEELARIRKAQGEQGDRAGKIAQQQVKPDWQKNQEEWSNTLRQYRKAYDDMITGLVQKGQDLWTGFLETGKIDTKDLSKFIIQQIGQLSYRTMIGDQVTGGAKSFAGFLFGAGGSKGRKESGGIDDVGGLGAKDLGGYFDSAPKKDSVAESLRESFGDLKSAMTPVIDKLGSFGNAVLDAIQKLFSASSSGGGSDFGSLLGSFFGGGGGGEGITNSGTGSLVENGLGAAGYRLGGTFGTSGAYAFAAGGVFDRATPFHFARGAGFSRGVMGEAGPEAVMPLTRGPGGVLGVANHGGGGGGNNYVTVENHGQDVRSQETTKPNGDKEVKVVVRQAVNEVNRQLKSGGQTAKTLNSRGVSLSRGLSRRG